MSLLGKVKRVKQIFKEEGITVLVKKVIYKIEEKYNWEKAYLMPTYGWLEITTRCNSRCRTCDRSYFDIKPADMTVMTFEKAKKALFPHLSWVTLQGYGEPLYASHFHYFLDEVLKAGIRPAFTTNGILLNEDVIRTMVEAEGNITVSIDGITEEVHRKIRPTIPFEKVMKNTELIASIKRQHPKKRFHFFINFVATSDNIHQLPDLIEYASQLGVQRIIVFSLGTNEKMGDFRFKNLFYHQNVAKTIFQQAKEIAKKLQIELILPLEKWLKNEVEMKKSTPLPPCYMPWEAVYIDVHGKIKPCCFHIFEPLGDIHNDDFNEVWNGEKYRLIRKTVNSEHPMYFCAICNVPPRSQGMNLRQEHQSSPVITLPADSNQ